MEKVVKSYDVVIVGAGCAGLMLARELGKQKINTLVLEKRNNLLEFSFYTLGSFMNPNDFGLSQNVIAQKTKSLVIHSKNFNKKIAIDGCTLDKRKVHEELLAKIDTNFIDIKTGITIVDIIKDKNNNFTSVLDKNKNEYSAKLFVDASGNNRVFSKKIGLIEKDISFATGVEYNVEYFGDNKEAHLMIGNDYQGGYGWIFPLKNNRAIIGFGSFEKKLVKKLKSQLNHIIQLPNIRKIVKKDNEKVEGGSVPITPVLDKFVFNNLICVGDSVSQVNPIAGEGYKFIFEAAIMASKAINIALNSNNYKLLYNYEKEWKLRFLDNYKRSKIAQKRINNFSKSDLLINLGVLLLKLRSNKSNLKSISGEYY